MLDSDDDDKQSEKQISDTKANFLIEYKKRLPRVPDELKYRQIIRKKFGGLSHIARTDLSSPATSILGKQFFIAAGIIYDLHRNKLLGDKAAKLVFLKYNLPLLSFTYNYFKFL